MTGLLQLLGAALIGLFFYRECGAINIWMWENGIGIAGLNPAVAPTVLGVLTFLILWNGRAFDTLFRFCSIAVAGAVAWLWQSEINTWAWSLGLGRFHPAIAPFFAGVTILAFINICVQPFVPAMTLKGRGLATSPVVRRLQGAIVKSVFNLAILAVALGAVTLASPDGSADIHGFFQAPTGPWAAQEWFAKVLTVFNGMMLAGWVSGPFRVAFAYVTMPFRKLWLAAKTGLGGSAAFLGQIDEWLMVWKPGRILIGKSMFEPRIRLGRNDDRHFLVVATTRSGKGRSFIIPNLLSWPGSTFVIDPKGENAAVTARIRKTKLGQTVHVLDPFSVLERLSLPRYWWNGMGEGGQPYRTARYNPLSDLVLTDDDIVEQINNIGAALVVPHPEANPFWDNASQEIFAGVVAHVLVSDRIKNEDRHFGTVRDYVLGMNGRSLKEMSEPVPAGKPILGGLAMAAWNIRNNASDTAGGDIQLTLQVHMRWLGSEAIRTSIAASDFSLTNLKATNTSIYAVVPPEYLATHACYMRLLVTMSLRAAGKGAKARHSMLFMLDEFPSLGRLDVVAEAAAQLTGMGIKLVVAIQNITQLQIYGSGWEVFTSNAGQHQIFAVNDRSTADYYSDRLGGHMAWRRVQGQGGTEWQPYGVSPLRTKGELARETSRASGQALISLEGGESMLVRRANYDREFQDYDWNPYENTFKAKRRRWFGEARHVAWTYLVRAALGRIGRKPAAGSAN